MVSPVIEIKGLGKRYLVGQQPFWALRDIDLEVHGGDVLGIVGRNGAGKTTLLRVLSRITDPDEGHAVIRGRIGTLLETGTGFHEDLSGRENVFLNGAILGMKPVEVLRKMEQIIEFSGVGKFIDSSVKSYSSGMRSRLAFSVAAHLDTEVLLVDEVLAVGDLAFQEKCLKKMDELTNDWSRTVLFVSHSMGAIQSLCNRAILIEGGRIEKQGPTEQVTQAYHDLMLGSAGKNDLGSPHGRPGGGQIRIVGMRLEGVDGALLSAVPAGSAVRMVFEYECNLETRPQEVVVTVVFVGSKGVRLFGLPSDVIRAELSGVKPRGRFVCTLPKLMLVPGHYDLVMSVLVDRQLADKLWNVCHVAVSESDYFGTGRLQQSNFGDSIADFSWGLE